MNSQIVKQSRFEYFLLRVGDMTRKDLLRWHRFGKIIHADFRVWRLTLIDPIDDGDSPELELALRVGFTVEIESVLFGGKASGLAWLWDMAQAQINRLQAKQKKPFTDDKEFRELVSTDSVFFVERFLLDTVSM